MRIGWDQNRVSPFRIAFFVPLNPQNFACGASFPLQNRVWRISRGGPSWFSEGVSSWPKKKTVGIFKIRAASQKSTLRAIWNSKRSFLGGFGETLFFKMVQTFSWNFFARKIVWFFSSWSRCLTGNCFAGNCLMCVPEIRKSRRAKRAGRENL